MKKLVDISDRKTCLDEIKINRYVLKECSAQERKDIEKHLLDCFFCRSEVIFLKKAMPEIQDEKKWGEVPDGLYEKGMEIVKKMTHVSKPIQPLEICLRFLREQWKIMRYSGIMIAQPTLAARGDVPGTKCKLTTIVKEFNGFRVEVDVKGDKKGIVDLLIRVKNAQDYSLVQKVLFTLMDEKTDRVLEECPQDGEVSFEGIELGDYSIHISREGQIIGEVKLALISG